MRKYGIKPDECNAKLRVIIVIGVAEENNILKQQILTNELHKKANDCALSVHTEFDPNSEKLEEIFQADPNWASYWKSG